MKEQNDRYVLGFPEMDVQHSYCYRLFDAIAAAASSAAAGSMAGLLNEIERYLMFHFECEEHLMRMYEFPGFAEHQSDHERFAGRLVRFLDDFQEGALNTASFKIFCTGWLMEHSSISDRAYVEWITQRRKVVFGERM